MVRIAAVMGIGLLASSLSIPFSSSARADDTNPPAGTAAPDAAQTPPPEEKAERIEVTGSHIKRTDVEGVSPVETVTRQEIEKKGYDNLGDVVRDLGVNTFGSTTVPSGNSSVPGNADINLRGLGADNTLVLLNGVRLPQDAITGTVDINLIPMAAVERIEILKDGASAIYGSDALGGVVNIITRKDFKGTELSATQKLPLDYADGKETSVSAVNGVNGESYNIVTSANFHYNQPIASRNRPWSAVNFSQLGNPGSAAPYSTSSGDGTWAASSNCPANLIMSIPGVGTFCEYEYTQFSEEFPQITEFGVMSEGHFDVNPNFRAFARLNFTYRDADTIAAPSPATPGQVIIPASAPIPSGDTAPMGPNGQDVAVRLTTLGTRNTDVQTDGYGLVTGGTFQLPNDWALDATLNFSLIHNGLRGTSGYALASTVANLIESGAVNPFAPVASQGSYASASYVPTENSQSAMAGLEVKASGDITEWYAGTISAAFGALANYSDYFDETDAQTLAGNVLGNAGGSGAGHRTAEAAYAEFSIPLAKKKLELSLAGRFDNYSDFGSTFNPKAGLLWHASPSWLIRASVGTGFRAPLLTELYAGQSVGYPSFIDYVACNSIGGYYCQAQQYQVTSGGNPGLKQETSVYTNAGVIFSPTSNFNIGVDGFYTDISNMPGIDLNDMTRAEVLGINPANYGVIVNRSSSGVIESVVAPLQNLSETQELGMDVTASYTIDRFKIATEQNQLFFYKTVGFPGVPLTNKLGWNGNPAWRNTTSVTYGIADNQAATLASHTIPRQLTLDQSYELTPLTTFDLSYTYKSHGWGEVSIALVNILDSAPPLDFSNPTAQVNYSLYDPNGRQLILGYKYSL